MTNKLPSDRVPIKCETKRNGNQRKRKEINKNEINETKRNQRNENETNEIN